MALTDLIHGINFVPPVRRRKYPHLRPDECNIWRRFLELHPDRFSFVAYDVRVGRGQELPHERDPSLARDWKMLTQKRIDVVGLSHGIFHIIELKHVADVRSPGQCLAYCQLFQSSYQLPRPPAPLLIFQMIRPDVLDLCEQNGVEALRIW